MYEFNKIYRSSNELEYIKDAIGASNLQADGRYDEKVRNYMKSNFDTEDCFLVNSCTAALEASALLIEIGPGDEIIMPSYTYVTSASSFVRSGASIVFVDIEKSTMCLDLEKLEEAISKKTKGILVVHYAGISCDMDRLMDIANRHNLIVIEDAAQAIYSKYKDRYLGTIGHIGCFSFHETKNISSGGEGGMLLVNDKSLLEKAQMIIEKGTDRKAFLENRVSKYTWKTLGSSFGMSQLNAAFLMSQLEEGKYITEIRCLLLETYINEFYKLKLEKGVEIFEIPSYSSSNGHMFYIKLKNEDERKALSNYLKAFDIYGLSHYEPLHTSHAGMKYGRFEGEDVFTSLEAKRLLRLPLHPYLEVEDVLYISKKVREYFEKKL